VGDSERRFLDIVGSIYATVEEPASWPEVLRRIAELLRASVGTLDLYALAPRRGNIAAFWNLDPDFGRIYSEQFVGKNIWMNSRRAREIPPGVVITGQMLASDGELERSEFYQELLRPHSIFHMIGGRVLEQGVSAATLSFLRPKSKGPFSADQVALVEALMPHLLRAVQVHSRMAGIAEREEAVNDVIDRLTFGVVLVDRAGRPILVNRTASEIAALEDGLVIHREGIAASSAGDTESLLRLISQACTTCDTVGRRSGGTLGLSRPSLKPRLVVLVAPLTSKSRFLAAEGARAVLFITDPTAYPFQTSDAVARLFDLTSAESRLCQYLARGRSLEETALDLRISSNTVRTHLKRVFEKTGTHRQAELVLLLTKGIPFVRES
jgi:DNA-binding CsgD family transcriptional regulator/PAS domain-containing protein